MLRPYVWRNRTVNTLDYDLLVVGAGPAGLCAGMYGGRAKLKTGILEKGVPGGEILNTDIVEDYPGFLSITGPDLAAKFEEHARKFGAEIIPDLALEIYSEGDQHIVVGEEGSYRAPAVIVTAGGNPRKLGVPGEERLSARGVSYCAVCDGPFFEGQDIAVVGGGDAAVEEGTYLTKYARKLYVIHRRDELRAQKIIQERLFAQPNAEVIWDTVMDEIGGDQRVEYTTLRNVQDGSTRRLDVGAVFVFIGFTPNSNIFRDHIEHNEAGYLITNSLMETSIPGIYAAGDIREQLAKQVTTAVGDATTAALAAEKYIEALRHEEAHAAPAAAG